MLACVKGQEGFYRKAGLLRHTAVLALYPDPDWYVEQGILADD